METALIVAVLGLLAIAGASSFAQRLGVASPLILVLLGIGVSLLPVVPDVVVEPEWILAGVLPPLLYSASVSMPSLDFRREFTAISELSVVLVVISSLVLGLFFWWLIPDISFAWGVALGAVVSPTDAVATSIVKGLGVSPRVVTMLEGESLLNDATALVLLRTAIAGAAASVSLWGVLGTFAFSIAVASAIGAVVGWLNLVVRSRISDPTVGTVISFTIPFIASIPAELLGASGLVAAVVAGLVTGRGALARLTPSDRLAEQQNWKTIELVLEGAVFLLMGLELTAIVKDVIDVHDGVLPALLIALGGLVLVIAVRSGYVSLLVTALKRQARRREKMRPRVEKVKTYIEQPDALERMQRYRDGMRGPGRARAHGDRPRPPRITTAERFERARTRVVRMAADLDYFLSRPLGWREGTVVVWAGMRGAVTVAAAQTLPHDTPHRSMLILIAFVVAAVSLLAQGGTLKWAIRTVKPRPEPEAAMQAERQRLTELLQDAAGAARAEADEAGREASELSIIRAKRETLLRVRDEGTYSSSTLAGALEVLDAQEISLELRGG